MTDIQTQTEIPKVDTSVNIIEQAKRERELLQKENERLENNIREMKELQASALLSGTAGIRQEAQPVKEESPKEYAEKVLKGEIKAK